VTRARLYASLGAALGIVATLVVSMAKQSGNLEDVSGRFVAGATAPPVLAMIGLALYDRVPRLGGTLIVASAGLLLGIAAVGSADGTGLLWMPGALLLLMGAHGLVSTWSKRG
jgi:hypothetical protein